jgi:serine/threonine-protein kinase
VSPDGRRILYQVSERAAAAGQRFTHDLWVWDLPTQTATRLTFDGSNYTPLWTADGQAIIYGSESDVPDRSDLFRRAIDGSGPAEQLTTDALSRANAVSPDGAWLVLEQDMPPSGYDLMLLSLKGPPRLEPLLPTPFDERNAAISPDGRWMAYESSESGHTQVYVRPFPNAKDAQHQISTEGGRSPVWAPSGRELFFAAGSSMMAATVQLTPAFSASRPTKLFDAHAMALDGRFLGGTARTFDISPDGQRFLMLKQTGAPRDDSSAPTSMIVVQNWLEELKAKLP